MPNFVAPVIGQAPTRATRGDRPSECRPAGHQASAPEATEPGDRASESVAPDLAAELEAAYARLFAIETEVKAKQAAIEATAAQQQALLAAERDAACAAKMMAEEQARELAAAASTASRVANEAQNQAKVALARAERAEATLHQLMTLHGLQGWLLRWLASDLLRER